MKHRALLVFVLLSCGSLVSAQEQFLVPSDNLILEGVPKVPRRLVDRVARYTDFREAKFADWHPSKAEMLILTRFADTSQVHQVTMPGGARTQLTFEKDSIVGASYEPREGKYFVFRKSAGGNERYQLYRYDFDSGTITLLTDGKSRNSPPRWSRKSGRIAYTSTRRNGTDTDLYLMDPKDPKTDRLIHEFKGGGWAVLDWSPDDEQLLIGEYISINASHLYLYDLGRKTLTRISPASKEPVAYSGGQFTGDGKRIYTITDRGDEFRYLGKLSRQDGSLDRLWPTTATAHDVERFALTRDGKQLAVLVNDQGVGRLHVIGKAAVPLPPGSVLDLHWHPDGKRLALVSASGQSPPDIYVLDLDRQSVERWTRSETGGLVTADFVEPKLIEWKSFDSHKITGFLYAPPARFQGKRPVILDIHGGPESQFRPRFLGRNNYYLKEMGIALIYPNVRGSSGFGKGFLTLDNGFKREDSYKDIGALLDWIKGQPELDADRVMVTGGSYGGHMTLAVATYFP
ncbi:MAG TPA: prolyl oligopeptidase family serine peptidase, partial [Gemmataceae bacterium]